MRLVFNLSVCTAWFILSQTAAARELLGGRGSRVLKIAPWRKGEPSA